MRRPTLCRKWTQEPSGRVRHPFEPVVLAATFALIPVFIIQNDAESQAWRTGAELANWLIWTIFAAELALILLVADRKGAALRAHWLDAAVVVATIPLLGQLLSSLRFARFARLLRVVRGGLLLGRALQAERRMTAPQSLRYVAAATGLLVLVAGAAQATFDSKDFHSIWDAVWWAFVTVTTVGYGDVTPTTVTGRVIGILLMFVGIGFLATLTAAVASRFVRSESDPQRDEIIQRLMRIEAALAKNPKAGEEVGYLR